MSLKPFQPPALLLLALCSACSGSKDVIARSNELAAQHKYYQAYWVVAEARESQDSYTNDPELERVFWQRRLEYYLDRGRELVFEEQEEAAIEEFHRALGLDPDNAEAKEWIAKAKAELARETARKGETLRLQGKLHEALKYFQKATTYVPELPEAMEGIRIVSEAFQKRAEAAEEQYTLGIRTEESNRYKAGLYHFSEAERMDPTLAKARRRKAEAAELVAQERMQKAEDYESQGFYRAALMQYQLVEEQKPEDAVIKERIGILENEVEADNKCREAEMALRRDEFDAADTLLEDAYKLTVREKAKVNGLMLQARRRRFEKMHRDSRDLELEGRLSEALAGYEAVAKEWPNGLLDEKARITSLKAQIAEAEAAYKKGTELEKKGDRSGAVEAYREALLFYPNYKDLTQRIERLQGS